MPDITESKNDQTKKEEGQEPFLSIFDVPEPEEPVKQAQKSVPVDFDPEKVYSEFETTAEQERKERERNEAEIADKLSARATLLDRQEEARTKLTELHLTEDSARALPEKIDLLRTENQNIQANLGKLQETGQSLENETKNTRNHLDKLKSFLADFLKNKQGNVQKFGGEEIGLKRFEQLKDQTEQAIEEAERRLAELADQYSDWQSEILDHVSELALALKIEVKANDIMASKIDQYKKQFDQSLTKLSELNDQSKVFVAEIDLSQDKIEEILADERIPKRLDALEKTIIEEESGFADDLMSHLKNSLTEPEKLIIDRIARQFFAVERQLLVDSKSPLNEQVERVKSLRKSLGGTFNRIIRQTNVNLDALFQHLRNQRQESSNGALLPSSRGYNDVLMIAMIVGATGSSSKALDPFLLEAKSLTSDPKEIAAYTNDRTRPFRPIFSVIKAARDASNDFQQDAELFRPWFNELQSVLTRVDTSSLNDEQAYQQAKKEISEQLRRYVAEKRNLASEAAMSATEKLNQLKQKHDQLVAESQAAQAKLEEAQAALTIAQDGLAQANELKALVDQYGRLGPLKLGSNAKKLQDTIDEAAKLLLLKVSDLRRASELVQVDLGRFDISEVPTLTPKLEELKSALEKLISERRTSRDQRTEALSEIVTTFNETILSDPEFDRLSNDPWLGKDQKAKLFDKYREVEEIYRKTIASYELR